MKRFSLRRDATDQLPWVVRDNQMYLASFEQWDCAVKFLAWMGVL